MSIFDNFSQIIDVEKLQVHGIDSGITSIDVNLYSTNFEAYRDNVKEVLTKVKTHPSEGTLSLHIKLTIPLECPSIAKIRHFIQLTTNFDIGSEGSLAIQQGLLLTIDSISKLDISIFG